MSAAQRRRQQEIRMMRWPVTCKCGRKFDLWNGGTCIPCALHFAKANGIVPMNFGKYVRP